MTYMVVAFLPTDQIQVGFMPGGLVSNLAQDITYDRPNSAAYDTVTV